MNGLREVMKCLGGTRHEDVHVANRVGVPRGAEDELEASLAGQCPKFGQGETGPTKLRSGTSLVRPPVRHVCATYRRQAIGAGGPPPSWARGAVGNRLFACCARKRPTSAQGTRGVTFLAGPALRRCRSPHWQRYVRQAARG